MKKIIMILGLLMLLSVGVVSAVDYDNYTMLYNQGFNFTSVEVTPDQSDLKCLTGEGYSIYASGGAIYDTDGAFGCTGERNLIGIQPSLTTSYVDFCFRRSSPVEWEYFEMKYVTSPATACVMLLVSPCVANWSCSGYASCVEGELACNAVTDLNACGGVYAGNFSEFDNAECPTVIVGTGSGVPKRPVVVDVPVEASDADGSSAGRGNDVGNGVLSRVWSWLRGLFK